MNRFRGLDITEHELSTILSQRGDGRTFQCAVQASPRFLFDNDLFDAMWHAVMDAIEEHYQPNECVKCGIHGPRLLGGPGKDGDRVFACGPCFAELCNDAAFVARFEAA